MCRLPPKHPSTYLVVNPLTCLLMNGIAYPTAFPALMVALVFLGCSETALENLTGRLLKLIENLVLCVFRLLVVV